MDCCEFREKHSDFTDGLLAEDLAVQARQHLARCASCRRFDAALRTGLSALRQIPQVRVSPRFSERLRRRLRWELRVRIPVINHWSGAVGALLVLVTVGFITFDLIEARGSGTGAPAVVATRVSPAVVEVRPRVIARLADSAALRLDALHPFEPIMVVADTETDTLPAQLRLDVPAVWGGR